MNNSETSNLRKMPKWSRELVPPFILILFVIFAWYVVALRSGLSEFILPSPQQVLRAGWETRHLLWSAIATTMVETLLGLFISILLGVAIATIMDLSPFLRRALYPILVASQTVQILAIAPLLIIWFGFGVLPKEFLRLLSFGNGVKPMLN